MTYEQLVEETIDQLMSITNTLDKISVLDDSPSSVESEIENAMYQLKEVVSVLEEGE